MTYVCLENYDIRGLDFINKMPMIIDLKLDDQSKIIQQLPKGNPCQKFIPELEDNVYTYLDRL